MSKAQKNLFEQDNTICRCERCDARCKVDDLQKSEAKMLRRSKEPKGLCINCAIHDWLKNTYPPNLLLAQSGPKVLLYPHIQEQFTILMKEALADAKPDEINWELIVENWDLPFPHKLKTSGMNPCSEDDLKKFASGERPGLGSIGQVNPDPLPGVMTITSFEQLNKLEPGLGDEFRKCLRASDET